MAACDCGASAHSLVRPDSGAALKIRGIVLVLALLLGMTGCRPESPPLSDPESSETIAITGTATLGSKQATPKLTQPPGSATAPAPNTIDLIQSTPSITVTLTAQATESSPQVITVDNAGELVEIYRQEFGIWALVSALVWSPNGSMLAASIGDQVFLQAFSQDNFNPVVSLPIGALTPALAFSPDGQWLAAGSRDGVIRMWSVASLIDQADSKNPIPAVVQINDAHQKGVNSLEFSPDGHWLASGGNDAVVRLWETSTGELIRMLIGGTYAVPSVVFSPDGTTLAIANGEYIRLREAGSEHITGTFLSETPIYTLAYSPDGKLLAAGDISNNIRVWDPAQAFRSGSEDYPTPITLTGHNARPTSFRALVWDLAFSPDGSLLASAGGDQTIWLWEVASQQPLNTLTGHEAAVTTLAFSPDGTRLVSGGLDGTLILWGIP